MPRLNISLNQEAFRHLQDLSADERRDVREQAALVLERAVRAIAAKRSKAKADDREAIRVA